MRLLVVCAEEEGHGLRAGAGLLRAEMHRIRAGGDAVLRRPKHSVIVEAADSTKGQSFTCSALLSVYGAIWRLFHPCQPLFTSFFKILGKAKPQLYRRKAAIPTQEISRRFPTDRL